MPDIVCDTSPIQYLHQIELLHLLPALAGRIFIPSAVLHGLEEGRSCGIDLPDVKALAWLTVRSPSAAQSTPFHKELGLGETEVLMQAMEMNGVVAVLDDGLARKEADRGGFL